MQISMILGICVLILDAHRVHLVECVSSRVIPALSRPQQDGIQQAGNVVSRSEYNSDGFFERTWMEPAISWPSDLAEQIEVVMVAASLRIRTHFHTEMFC